MDVEKLQKINALANELKKHNFAKDNNDAVSQAEGIYDPKKKAEPEPQVKVEQIDDGLIEQKFQMLLQMHLKKYEEELAGVKNALSQLHSQVAQLKTVKSEPKQEKQEELKAAPPHPKRGNYTSADVDVQKMFYFGNKR
ncbi:hypothetical protein KY329_03650 [Candidatus Woesearchaeota archaeon]|nr:hypothetical protein [Candidatus Woesearchaeota archaeon]